MNVCVFRALYQNFNNIPEISHLQKTLKSKQKRQKMSILSVTWFKVTLFIMSKVYWCNIQGRISVKDIVQQAEKAYCDTFNAASVDGADMSPFYTSDCAYMPPGSTVICGKASEYQTFLNLYWLLKSWNLNEVK